MSAPWPPPRPEPDPRKVAEALAALRRVNRRLDRAERRMAELERGEPSLLTSAWRGFQIGFAAVLIALLLLLA